MFILRISKILFWKSCVIRHTRCQIDFALQIKIFLNVLKCITSKFWLSFTWGNTHGRHHTSVAIVKRLFHKNIILRYTWKYTLVRSHTFVTIVAKLSSRTVILSFTWGSTQGGDREHKCSYCEKVLLKRYILRYTQK